MCLYTISYRMLLREEDSTGTWDFYWLFWRTLGNLTWSVWPRSIKAAKTITCINAYTASRRHDTAAFSPPRIVTTTRLKIVNRVTGTNSQRLRGCHYRQRRSTGRARTCRCWCGLGRTTNDRLAPCCRSICRTKITRRHDDVIARDVSVTSRMS